uniref:Uncharacterized protein n=1 Tax=Brassica oleracea var. oleracea TaxID=109376 RepID=A0A0D3D4Q9_BRAOL
MKNLRRHASPPLEWEDDPQLHDVAIRIRMQSTYPLGPMTCDVPLSSAPRKTDRHGLIMGSSKDICSLFDSYLPNHEASTHEITCGMFSTQLRSSSKKNQIKRSSYVTVMPFTNQVVFSSREFRLPEKLEMANLLSDEPMTNSIMPKEKPFDYPHQGPLLDTRRPLDDDLGPIFDEEHELGTTFDEKAPSMTSINMENHLCFDLGTTPTPLTTDIQEQCEKLDLINFLSEISFKVFEPDELLDQKRFQHDNGINSGFVLSFDQFLKHSKGFDHFKESLELDLQQPDFCARNSFDSFLFKENSFNLSCYRYALITESILIYNTFFDKSDDPWISNSRFEIDLVCSKSEKLAPVLNLFFSNCAITCPDTILVYNTYFDRLHDDLKLSWINKISLQEVSGTEAEIVLISLRFGDGSKINLRSNPFKEGGNDVPLGSAPRKTDMHGLIMGSSKDICSFFDSYLPNHEACTQKITWIMFSTQLRSSSKKNQIKRSSYVTVMPFTNLVIFSSREFRPPEKLEMTNLLSDEPMTNSIMPKVIIHVQNVQESLGLDGLQKRIKNILV